MKKVEKFRRKINDYLYDHIRLKGVLHETYGLFIAVLAAFIFAFGFLCFSTPGVEGGMKIVTGGVSGLSQTLAKILSMFGIRITDTLVEGMGYTLFNIPILVFSFFAIGKRFTIITTIHVVVSSIFISWMPTWGNFVNTIASSVYISTPGAHIIRVVFAALCTGLSSALTFKAEISTGGIDCISYYCALKKSTSVGKYSAGINASITCFYSLLIIIDNPSSWDDAILSIFFSVIYFFIVMLVVDAIHLRNKKMQIQFITGREDFGKILLAHFPHGATIASGKGAYSGLNRYIIYMSVSSYEVKKVVTLAMQIDPNAFINVTSLVQVYGNFFIRPIH